MAKKEQVAARRAELEKRFEDMETKQWELSLEVERNRHRTDGILKDTVWILEGTDSMENLYMECVETTDGGGYMELKRRLPVALHSEVALQLGLPYPLPKRSEWPETWTEDKVETALVFRTFEAALDQSVVLNVYSQDKWDWDLEDNIRLKCTFKLMLRFSLKQLQAAQCLRDKLDEDLRRAAGLQVFSDRFKKAGQTEDKDAEMLAADGDEKGIGKGKEAKVEDGQTALPALPAAASAAASAAAAPPAADSPAAELPAPPKKRLLIYAPKTELEKTRDRKRKERYEAKGKDKGEKGQNKGQSKGSKGSKDKSGKGKSKSGKKGGKGRGQK